MPLKFCKLRGRIVEKFGSQSNFCKQLKVANTVVSRKLNGSIAFTRADIIKWCELLEITQEEIGVYFFD